MSQKTLSVADKPGRLVTTLSLKTGKLIYAVRSQESGWLGVEGNDWTRDPGTLG